MESPARRLFGDHKQAKVVLVPSHMGQRGDNQEDWWSTALALSSERVAVLPYDRRGVCSSDGRSCSDASDILSENWRDAWACGLPSFEGGRPGNK